MRYNDIINVRKNFDDTFNIVQEKSDSWKLFITNAQFEKNLSMIVKSFSAPLEEINERKSIWVQGTYGTGKSHSTSVIKHILCDKYEEIKDFVATIYSTQLRYQIEEFRKWHRSFPVVLKGRYTITDVKDMLYVLQQETRKALTNAGIEINIKTDYEIAINMLENESYESWWNSLLKKELKIYCQSKEDVRKRLLENDKEILTIIDRKFKNDIGGSFGTTNIVEWLRDVKNQLVSQGVYDSLFIIWDEFTSLLSGQECRSILNTVQDIAELSKALDSKHNPENIYILLVTHKNMEQTDAYRMKDEEERKLALDRFIKCEYVMQPNTIYHILSSSLNRLNEDKLNKLIDERINKCFVVKELIEKIANYTIGDSVEIAEKITSLYPIHPYTAYLSTFVSRQLGASERSVFNYLNDSKVGFKYFLSENIEEKKFLLADSIWDFFLTINNVSQSNSKLSEIISKYNMHLDEVKKMGSDYVSVFKTILLLNVLNSVVDSGEDSNERKLVNPNYDNISDCYAGVETSDAIKEKLNYFDEHSIIIKSPDGLFEVSTSALSQNDLRIEKESNLQYFNEITKALETFPIDSDSLRNILKKNNGQTVRSVVVDEISSTLKNTQIETRITSKISSDTHSLFVVLVYSHEEYSEMSKFPTRQRCFQDIEDGLSKLSQKEEFRSVVFVNVREMMPEQELSRFVDSFSRYKILEKNGNSIEAKREKQNSGGRIKRWIDHIINDGSLFVSFNGKSEICTVKELANNISSKYIHFVYDAGLDALKTVIKETIWKEKSPKSTLEAILYQTKRDDIDRKLKGGDITNFKALLRDENSNFIFDNDMRLIPSAPDSHPVVKIVKAVTNSIEEARSKKSTIDLYNELKYIFYAPYGYYLNPISFAAISLAMKQYIDKIFVTSEGTKINNTYMKDVIEALFNKHFKGKDSSKLKVRFSSDEEIGLIEKLNTIFELKESGLIQIRWSIRDSFKTRFHAPLWALKVLTEDQKLIRLVEELFDLTISPDETITESRMESLNGQLEIKKIELIQLLSKASKDANLMNNYIEVKLRSLNSSLKISEEMCNEYKEYIISHSQEDICFQKVNEIDTSIVNCYAEKIKEKSSAINCTDHVVLDKVRNNFWTENIVEDSTNEIIVAQIQNYVGDVDKLKSILLKVIEAFPESIDIIKSELEKSGELN